LRFVRRAIALRRDHAIFRHDVYLKGEARSPTGLKDIVWLRSDGEEMRPSDWMDASLQTFGCAFEDTGAGAVSRRYILLLNAGAAVVEFVLPKTQGGSWQSLLDTNVEDGSADANAAAEAVWPLAPRCLVLLAERL
jgi:glycogen operon protein